MNETNQLVNEFERNRNQLMMLNSQKQQLQMQSAGFEMAIEELSASKEKTVFKGIGNILIPKDRTETLSDLKKQKETSDLKIKTIEKQEKMLTDKLNSLKTQIEGQQKGTGTDF
ncbi:MAG: prefoldin subunit [Candidatus Diapherotrites archaeon]|nr:prefoldin subunit [Candidatus Diapherotrites archaeon]